jgi:hypothetical protein
MFKILKSSVGINYSIGVLILLLANNLACQAQLNATVFEDFSQTTLNPYLINPAATDSSYLFKIRLTSIDELGLSRYVNRFNLDIDKRINTSRKNAYHFVGLQAFNSKIGQYISRSRLQFRYCWFTQLSQKAFLSSGISLGFINYAFQTTQGGTGGSDFGPDGALGLHYIRERTVIGIAIQQIFSPVLMPVSQSFKLDRLYNFDISQQFNISPRFDLTTYSVIQYTGQKNLNFNLGLKSNISDYLLIGLNNFSFKKSSFNLGIQRIRLFGGEFMMVSTYSFYHRAFPAPNSLLELFLAFQK